MITTKRDAAQVRRAINLIGNGPSFNFSEYGLTIAQTIALEAHAMAFYRQWRNQTGVASMLNDLLPPEEKVKL